MSWILKNVQEFTWQRKQETFGGVERQMTRHGIVGKPAVCVAGEGTAVANCIGDLGRGQGYAADHRHARVAERQTDRGSGEYAVELFRPDHGSCDHG